MQPKPKTHQALNPDLNPDQGINTTYIITSADTTAVPHQFKMPNVRSTTYSYRLNDNIRASWPPKPPATAPLTDKFYHESGGIQYQNYPAIVDNESCRHTAHKVTCKRMKHPHWLPPYPYILRNRFAHQRRRDCDEERCTRNPDTGIFSRRQESAPGVIWDEVEKTLDCEICAGCHEDRARSKEKSREAREEKKRSRRPQGRGSGSQYAPCPTAQ